MCEHLHTQGCVFMCLCLSAPAWENGLNLIYSPRGHLLTESNPPTGPRQNGGLTRLLLYIAAVMGTSLEVLLRLICAPLPRFLAETPHILRTASLHRETPDALQLQRINQSTHSQLSYLSTCCLPGQWFLSGPRLGGLHSLNQHRPIHACPPPPPVREITGWMRPHSPVPSVLTSRV